MFKMMAHYSIPLPVTVVYVFGVINLTLLLNLSLVEANVIATTSQNQTLWEAPDKEALFGPPIPDEGIWAHLVAQSSKCCSYDSVEPIPHHNLSVKWIAMIPRGSCDFDKKVYNAQRHGYIAVIVHNVGSDDLERMGPGSEHLHINISSVFIGAHDAKTFAKYSKVTGCFVKLDNSFLPPFSPAMYLVPFIIVVGICFVLMLSFMVARWIRDVRHRRRSRLSLAHLKKIPVKKFKKGDQYDVCAICLDEYEDGDKLRILPCSHAYHQKCVDPWLTKNKKFCPICKRKVIPGDDDSDSDDDSDDDEGQNENTPLLAESTNRVSSTVTRGGTFEHSGLPTSLQNSSVGLPYDDTSSEESFSLSASNYHSSVEVHLPGPDNSTTLTFADEIQSDDTESASDDVAVSDADRDARIADHLETTDGASGLTNPAFPPVGHHRSEGQQVGSINNDGSRCSLDEYKPLMEEDVVVVAALPPDDRPVERDEIV